MLQKCYKNVKGVMENMKKMIKRVCSICLVFSMLMGCITVMGAETQTDAGTIKGDLQSANAQMIEEQTSVQKKSTMKKGGTLSSVDKISTLKGLNGLVDRTETGEYDGVTNFMTYAGQKENFTFKAPVSGKLIIYMLYDGDNASYSSVQLLKADGSVANTLTNKLAEDGQSSAIVNVTSGCTYTIRFTQEGNSSSGDAYAFCMGVIYGTSSRSFLSSYTSSNCSIGAGTNASGRITTYWKKKVTSKGRMAITAADIFNDSSEAKNVSVTLLNSNKTAVSKTISLNNKTAYFGVYGGRTYYVKVQTYAPVYGIKCTMNTSYKSTVGTSKSKATKISKGYSKSAVLGATTSTSSQWYKIYVPKRKGIKVTIEGYFAPGASVKAELRTSGGKVLTSKTVTGKSNYKHTITFTGSNVAKGTYYIKISKGSNKSSAAYKIKYVY